MLTVHKYELAPITGIKLPKDAQILTIQMQGDTPYMWVLLDTDKPTVDRCFISYGTGHEIDKDLNITYIGTFQMHSGSLVFHVFESHEVA